MTKIQSSTLTTTQIRHEGSIALSTSFDCTGTDTLTKTFMPKLQSLIDPAIAQWWNSLSRAQRSAVGAQKLSLKISASCLHQSQRPVPEVLETEVEIKLLPSESC